VRILRDEGNDYEKEDFITVPKLIEKGEVVRPAKLYNYLIFKGK
jgi:hypothetical protein